MPNHPQESQLPEALKGTTEALDRLLSVAEPWKQDHKRLQWILAHCKITNAQTGTAIEDLAEVDAALEAGRGNDA